MAAELPHGKEAAETGSGSPIRAGESARTAGDGNHAGFLLVVFMRLLAGLWVLQGLMQWGAILMPKDSLFDTMPALSAAAVIFFSILDLVAAVGLWLVTPWGGVIWLLSAIAQIFAAIALPGFFSLSWIAAVVVLIAIYFVLTWRAGHAGSSGPRHR